MTRTTASARPWFFWPIIAFIAGLFIGLVVIGWGLWPVQWTNALPSDLRSDLQYNYLTMVAESYAATGDLATAQQRVESFDPEALGKTLVELQEYLLDTNPARASDVQSLIAALQLDSTRPDAIATPVPAEPGLGERFSSLCTAVLWAALVIGGIALLAWLFRYWSKVKGGKLPDKLSGLANSIHLPRRGSRTPGEIVEDEKERDVLPPQPAPPAYTGTVSLRNPPPEAVYVRQEDVDFDDEPPEADVEEVSPPTTVPVRPPPVEPAPPVAEPPRRLPEEVSSVPPAAKSFAGAAAADTLLPRKLGEFKAVFPDERLEVYEEIFDLKDNAPGVREQDRFLGQCSVTVHRPEGITRGPAYAFQLWLSDRRDSDYQVRVLMSDGAYRNTGLRAEYAGRLDVVPVRPGQEVEMSTRNLLLRARVEDLDYDESQQPLHGVFSKLHLRLIAYKRSA